MARNKKIAQVTIGLLGPAALIIGLAACSSDDAERTAADDSDAAGTTTPERSIADPLQSYIDASRDALQAEFDRYSDVYSDFSMEAEGSRTLVYRYTFRSQLDAAQARSNLASMDDTLEATANSVIFPEMRAAGIDDPVVKWIYHNSDGTIITTVEVN